mmetsp:Transcript_67825/g.198452  ORF Transcript_67825/g.198452 Transcript_67825/m.198452 type:complete len:316 (-) Transcript_67825:485-1432(-)
MDLSALLVLHRLRHVCDGHAHAVVPQHRPFVAEQADGKFSFRSDHPHHVHGGHHHLHAAARAWCRGLPVRGLGHLGRLPLGLLAGLHDQHLDLLPDEAECLCGAAEVHWRDVGQEYLGEASRGRAPHGHPLRGVHPEAARLVRGQGRHLVRRAGLANIRAGGDPEPLAGAVRAGDTAHHRLHHPLRAHGLPLPAARHHGALDAAGQPHDRDFNACELEPGGDSCVGLAGRTGREVLRALAAPARERRAPLDGLQDRGDQAALRRLLGRAARVHPPPVRPGRRLPRGRLPRLPVGVPGFVWHLQGHRQHRRSPAVR